MKRVSLFIAVIFLLCGCSSKSDALDAAMQLRSKLLSGNGCSFVSDITADYGDELYSFSISCIFDRDGNLQFSVVEPETIDGITGSVDQAGGALTFDDKVLAFPMLADDQITPVTAPWVMIKALRSGYFVACGKSGDGYQIKVDDSYEENSLRLDIWADADMCVNRCEFLWQGRRVLSMDVRNYKLL